MQQARESFWKRYFVLIAAVGLFLAISALLIGATLYLSNDIARGTQARKLAGNERSATQVVLLELTTLDRDLKAGRPPQQATIDNLKSRSELVADTIKVFREGGRMPGDTTSVVLEAGAGATGEMVNVNSGVNVFWAPYMLLIDEVVKSRGADQAKLDKALEYGLKNNEQVFGLLNERVDDAQKILQTANNRLRTVQTVGAVLIALNFLFTVLVAFRRLNASDRAVVQSRKQTDDILATVKEGLFLVTGDFVIGEQMSSSLSQIMQRKVTPGMNLLDVLQSMVTPQTLESTRDYLGLLFGKRVKENLVASLNPLSEVPVAGGSDGRGQLQSRYLNFQFNRVQESEDTVYLLVTVSDASERVRLINEISSAKTRTREEMESLLRVLSRESSEVRFFLNRVGVVLERVNEDLRQAAGRRGGTDYGELVNAIFRDVHSLKSEAAALSLEMIEALAHNFEVDLIGLRDRGSIEGSDMVKMTVHLDDMFECVTTIRDFLDRIGGGRDVGAGRAVLPQSQRAVEGWNTLAERIAREQGKQVQLEMQLQAWDRLSAEPLNAMRTIGLQLLRNAVAHGIETADERRALGKPAVGAISFHSEDVGSRQVELVVRDDGRGIDARRVRAALAESGRYTPEQLAELGDREAIMKIFEPGVSTAAGGDRDAGHGIGMDLVMKQVRALSGTISLATKVGAYTEFRVRLPVAEPRPAASADGAGKAAELSGGPSDFQMTL